MKFLAFESKAVFRLLVLFAACLGCDRASLKSATPTTTASNAPKTEVTTGLPRRRVEVALLGKLSEMKGFQWPGDPDRRWLSRSVEEPCDVTISLPSGKRFDLRTRPILIVSRVMDSDRVAMVYAPPEGRAGSLRDKAAEVRNLLSEWKVVPDDRLERGLTEWERHKDLNVGIAGQVRAMMDLDSQCQVFFRVDSGIPPMGGWNLTVEFTGNIAELNRITSESRAAAR